MIYSIRGKHANHYTNNVVAFRIYICCCLIIILTGAGLYLSNSDSVSWQKNSNSAICKGIYKSLKLSYLKKYIRNIYFSKYWYCFCCINISNSIAYTCICWSMDCSMVRSEGCPYPGSHPIHFIIKS